MIPGNAGSFPPIYHPAMGAEPCKAALGVLYLKESIVFDARIWKLFMKTLCPYCNQIFDVGNEWLGQQMVCPACGSAF